MKTLTSLSFACLLFSFCFSAQAIAAFPRDLVCETNSGVEIALKSNNSLWTDNGGNHKVTLDVDGSLDMPAAWVNNRATHTRGNDQGLREYIFTSVSGETFHVSLEFHAPFGQATGIKAFKVRSVNVQFFRSQRSLSSDVCKVVFYQRTEI